MDHNYYYYTRYVNRKDKDGEKCIISIAYRFDRGSKSIYYSLRLSFQTSACNDQLTILNPRQSHGPYLTSIPSCELFPYREIGCSLTCLNITVTEHYHLFRDKLRVSMWFFYVSTANYCYLSAFKAICIISPMVTRK